MNSRALIQASWILLALAVLAWVGATYFAWVVLTMQSRHAEYMGNFQNAMAQQAQAAKVRTIARETVSEREVLDKVASVDLVSAVNMIEDIGTSAGATVHVSGAQAGKPILGKSGVPPINVVTLSVQSQGSYAAIMKVLKMLEVLPVAISIQQMDLVRSQSGDATKASTWSLNANLRFFTTATISS